MNSRRPFRLGLKSRSADSEYNRLDKSSNGSSTYVHPLAGQQDILRKTTAAQQAEAGPSRSRDNLSYVSNSRREPDVETLSGTNGWFRSLAADEESLYSSHSAAEADFGSLSATLQEVVLEQQQQQQQRNGSTSGEFSVIRQPNQQRISSQTPEKKQEELLQMAQQSRGSAIASPAREGGIIGRLKRISKKEKSRAAEEEAFGLDLERKSIHHADEMELSSTSTLPSFDDTKKTEADPMLSLREAALTKTPQLERPKNDRIQSIQPSLVDDESIRDAHSIAGSQAGFDEEDWRDRLMMNRSKAPMVPESVQGSIGFMDEDGGYNYDSAFDTTPSINPIDRNPFTNGQYAHLLPSTPSDVGYSFETPLIDIEPSTPGESVFFEADRSEYGDAASGRAYSSYDSVQDRLSMLIDEQDEGAATPRAAPEGDRPDYFAASSLSAPAMSTAPSLASIDTASTPTKAVPVKKYTWYQSANLDPQQRHYFLRHVLSRELLWEFERLFLVPNCIGLYRPSPKHMLPRSDIGYFKKEAKDITPDLPLMRFLFTHVLSTCPLFGPAQPIEGAAAVRARKAGARAFLDEALLPFLRFQKEASLNCGVDLNGEWPSELFDSPSTTDVMLGSIFKTLVKLISAAVPDGKSRSLPWSSIPTPSSAAYIRHRVAPSKLRQGGMEVNVVGARLPSSGKDCELLLSVRRFGFPPHFVVRSESDFYEYALGLAEELGRDTRIRAVPPPIRHEGLSLSVDEATSVASDHSYDSLGKLSRQPDQLYGRRNLSQTSLRSMTPPKAVRSEKNDSLARLKGGNDSSASFGSSSSVEMPRQTGPAAISSMAKAPPEKIRFLYRGKAEGGTDADSSKTSLGSTAVPPRHFSPPLTQDAEARRKQLRAWLRDALSVRGAGHAKETRAFLESGSFSEKEIKAATKKDIENRGRIDARLIQEREVYANNASDEIIELQREMKALWKDCIEGDGLLKALEAIKAHDTFGALPLPYQRVISWTNLQIAQFIHHVFLNSNEARSNFDRATELLQCIPWKALSFALREPTGLMIQRVKASLSGDFVIKKMLAVQLQDVPVKKMELEINSLRKRLGSTIMRKLESYVVSPGWQKRVIKKAAKKNGIPLVSAIVRGDDKPLLAADGIKRIMTATRVYQEFIKTQPTYEEKKAKIRVNVEVRLITDMQRALRLLSLRRNGFKVREALTNELKKPMEAFLEPFFSLLKRLHRARILAREGGDVVVDLQKFLYKLFDVLAGLKMRVQDPWRSLSTLTLFLDDVIPSWYRLLHHFATGYDSAFLLDITQWLQGIFSLLSHSDKSAPASSAAEHERENKGKGPGIVRMEEELAPFWQPPKGGVNQADQSSIMELIKLAKLKKARLMESACRWAAGDLDADYSIQLLGEGGKTRMTPFHLHQDYAAPPASLSKQDGLDVYLPGLRSALSQFM